MDPRQGLIITANLIIMQGHHKESDNRTLTHINHERIECQLVCGKLLKDNPFSTQQSNFIEEIIFHYALLVRFFKPKQGFYIPYP